MGEKTENDIECERIAEMTAEGLLSYALGFPEYLADGYYSEFRNAVYRRACALGINPES